MSNRKDRKSLMNTFKKSFKSVRSASSRPSKSRSGKHHKPSASITGSLTVRTTTNLDHSYSTDNININTSMHVQDGSGLASAIATPSATTVRKTSFMTSFAHRGNKNSERELSKSLKRSSISQSKSTNQLHPFDITPINGVTNMAGLGLSKKPSTQKLKSSGKYTLPFTVPSLYINKRPDMFKNVGYDGDEFNHLLSSNADGIVDRIVIPINIDIEQVYNEEYDNNYNRKLLGPLKPVRFPLLIECIPDDDILLPNDNEYGHIESDSEYVISSDDDDLQQEELEMKSAKPLQIISARSNQNFSISPPSFVVYCFLFFLCFSNQYIQFITYILAQYIYIYNI